MKRKYYSMVQYFSIELVSDNLQIFGLKLYHCSVCSSEPDRYYIPNSFTPFFLARNSYTNSQWKTQRKAAAVKRLKNAVKI
eukprot:747940-Hanusia_phi.AAC.3